MYLLPILPSLKVSGADHNKVPTYSNLESFAKSTWPVSSKGKLTPKSQTGKGPSFSSKRLSKINPKEVLQHSMASASTPLQSLNYFELPDLKNFICNLGEAILDLERFIFVYFTAAFVELTTAFVELTAANVKWRLACIVLATP
uniref:Uncharacterized protein n=1 Tax=Glossina pallidipes TaxID=7398 RepID=A0A1A9ZLU6_GLOPL